MPFMLPKAAESDGPKKLVWSEVIDGEHVIFTERSVPGMIGFTSRERAWYWEDTGLLFKSERLLVDMGGRPISKMVMECKYTFENIPEEIFEAPTENVVDNS